ncbi:DMT family transporter [Pseudoroseicyclus sp. CLL3-39]|uniref:DMT family transporter n=2 Tax=Pseudoroseicyclus tamaricis TaxID=2705421 RepID=A0A6B2JRT6_9RHOB|nr:DMT family transporter [Pseudoroseicyclus tamaricis]
MVLSGLSFVCMTAIVKTVGTEVPAAEASFLRYIMGVPLLLPMLGAVRRAKLTPRLWALFSARALVHSGAVILWFFAIARIPLAEVTAMNYLNPIYVTLGAALIFGERLALRRILAIGVALIGVVIMLRPGFRELDPGHFAMLAVSVCFAGSYLFTKQLAGEVSPTVIVTMLSLLVPICLFPFALVDWQTPSLTELAWFAGTAVFATLGHYFMTVAFAAAPMTVTQPVTFLQLVWATTLGWLAFGESIDSWVVIGALLIMGAIGYMTFREAQLKRAARTPPPAATRR